MFRAFNSAEAQLIRSQLDAANFNVFVADETSALSMEGYLKSRNFHSPCDFYN